MKSLKIEYKPSEKKLKEMKVSTWPIWAKDPCEYDREYEMPETCFYFEGEAKMIPETGEPVEIKSGTLLTIPAQFKCRWEITKELKMRYLLG